MDRPQLRVVHEPYPFTDAFRRDWESLHARAIGANVFTALEWLEQGWTCFAPPKGVLRPVRFVDASGDTAAMAVHRQSCERRCLCRTRVWRSVEYNSQRIAPILAPDFPTLAAAMLALYRDVAPRFDRLDLFKLDPLDGQLQQLTDVLASEGLRPRLEPFNVQPRVVLPETWEEYRASRGKKAWETPRRLRRRMADELGEVRHVRIRTPQDAAAHDLNKALDDVFAVFERSWQIEAVRKAGVVTPDQMRCFYTGLAPAALAAGRLDLNLLYGGSRLTAYDLNLVHGKSVYMIFGCFDKELERFSPGTVLFVDELMDSHARGDRIIELGGEYLGYKEQWAKEKIPAFRLRLRGRTFLARLRSCMERP